MGIFVANGPGIRRDLTLRELSILDVAPILLYSLGLAIPENIEGRVPLEMFEPSFRSRQPIRIAPWTGAKQRPSSESEVEITYDSEAEKIILDRLKGLGYIS